MASSSTWEIVKRYRWIIASVALFFIVDVTVMTTNFISTYHIKDYGVSINLAGRQRMLSQRTAKVLLSLQDDSVNGQPMQKDLQELALVVHLFDSTLKGFDEGDPQGRYVISGDGVHKTPLSRVVTPSGRGFISKAYEIWKPYFTKLQPLLADVQAEQVLYQPRSTGGKIETQPDGEPVYVTKYIANSNPTFSHAQLVDVARYGRDNNLKLLGFMNSLTGDLEHSSGSLANTLRYVQLGGLLFCILNVFGTLLISLRSLMRGEIRLAKARKETMEIFQTVREGLFLLDPDYKIGSQFSTSLPAILRREVEPGASFMEILKSMTNETVFNSARDFIELLFGDRVKEALVSDLNPLDRIEVAGKSGAKHYLNFNFNRVFENGKISSLLVTVQDVTDVVNLSNQLEESKKETQREIEIMLDLMSKDPTSLVQFINNTEQALAQINERMRNNDDTSQGRLHTIAYIMRVVHGIKGEASALKLNMFETYAHDFEQELTVMRDRNEIRGSDIVRITVLLDGFYDRLSSISVVAKRAQGDGNTRSLETEPSALLAEHFNNLIERVTQNAGKQAKALIDVSAVDMLPRRIINEIQQIGIQLIRNAVKHGIETPDERIAAGKQPVGEIRIACKDIGRGHYAFYVRDDGRGISIEKIRQRLVESGAMSESDVAAMSPRDVIMSIFKSGFSTSPEADRDAGRGVGLNVVTDKVVQLHGNLTLNSKTGMYTEFRISFEV